MDAKVDDWVDTPRIGKPVEINALWFNALRIMDDFAHRLGQPYAKCRRLAEQAQAGFSRFWNKIAGYCFDVLDGPLGYDASFRPNQLLAVSLLYSPLGEIQQKAIVDICSRDLLTSFGMRSLADEDRAFVGEYGGDQMQRDEAYHQGTVWGWPIGPFVDAHLRVYGDHEVARDYLRPQLAHQVDHGLGSISEIFDDDPPFTPRGCPAQAWSVAELLRAWAVTSRPEIS